MFKNREEFEEALSKSVKGMGEALEKAKFISPGQQKANRQKAKEQSNKDTLKESSLGVSQHTEHEKPTHTEEEYWNHVKTHWEKAAKDPSHPDHKIATGDKDTFHDHRSDHFAEITQENKPIPGFKSKQSHLKVIKKDNG